MYLGKEVIMRRSRVSRRRSRRLFVSRAVAVRKRNLTAPSRGGIRL